MAGSSRLSRELPALEIFLTFLYTIRLRIISAQAAQLMTMRPALPPINDRRSLNCYMMHIEYRRSMGRRHHFLDLGIA